MEGWTILPTGDAGVHPPADLYGRRGLRIAGSRSTNLVDLAGIEPADRPLGAMGKATQSVPRWARRSLALKSRRGFRHILAEANDEHRSVEVLPHGAGASRMTLGCADPSLR